jgi:hypothetical protein
MKADLEPASVSPRPLSQGSAALHPGLFSFLPFWEGDWWKTDVRGERNQSYLKQVPSIAPKGRFLSWCVVNHALSFMRGKCYIRGMKKILLTALLLTVFASSAFAAGHHHHHHHHHAGQHPHA